MIWKKYVGYFIIGVLLLLLATPLYFLFSGNQDSASVEDIAIVYAIFLFFLITIGFLTLLIKFFPKSKLVRKVKEKWETFYEWIMKDFPFI